MNTTLRQHLLAGRARHQPGLSHIHVHDLHEGLGRLIHDLGDLVDASGQHQNVHPAEALDRGLHHLAAIFSRAWPNVDGLDLGAELLAIGRDLLEGLQRTGRQHEIAAGARQHLGGQRPERARRAGHDGGLAANVEQGERIF
jgi:hypothetical protein